MNIVQVVRKKERFREYDGLYDRESVNLRIHQTSQGYIFLSIVLEFIRTRLFYHKN